MATETRASLGHGWNLVVSENNKEGVTFVFLAAKADPIEFGLYGAHFSLN